MKDFDIRYGMIMLIGVFISSISQVVLKKSAQKKYDSVYKEYLNIPVITAYFIFFLATLMSVFAYRGIPLYMGPVLETTGYIYVMIFGLIFFDEKINKKKILALLLVVMGIVICSIYG